MMVFVDEEQSKCTGQLRRWSSLTHKHPPKARPIDGEVPVATRSEAGSHQSKQNKDSYSH